MGQKSRRKVGQKWPEKPPVNAMNKPSNLYLHPKSKMFYVRKIVPADIRHIIGQSQIKKSLGTKDETRARVLAEIEAEKIDADFRKARALLSPARAIEAAYKQRLDSIANQVGDFFQLNLTEAQFPAPIDFGDIPPPPEITTNAVEVQALPKPQTNGKTYTVRKIFDRYAAERQPTDQTKGEFERAWDAFFETSNLTWESPITAITKAHLREFKDYMLQMPVNILHSDYRDKKVPEIAAMLEGNTEVARVSPATVNKKIGGVSAVLGYAFDNDYITINPAIGLKVKLTKKGKEAPRDDYEKDDLTHIFGCQWFKEATWTHIQWMPLIALYTGCRLEEIGQLRITDIKTEEGIPFFHITTLDDEGNRVKSVKTETSLRKVPIHKDLIGFGFLEYVASIKGDGHTMLFPELKEYRGKMTHGYSKWYGKQRKVIQVTDKRKTFHSFRHTFKTASRRGGVTEEMHDTLTGHSGKSVGRDYGAYPITVLKEQIDRITYELPIKPDK